MCLITCQQTHYFVFLEASLIIKLNSSSYITIFIASSICSFENINVFIPNSCVPVCATDADAVNPNGI